jgi:hypothetical protein
MNKILLFSDTIYLEEDLSWLKTLNDISDDYIKEATNFNKEKFINNKDIGLVHHSELLTNDIKFLEFIKFICKKSHFILDEQGYDLKNYLLVANDLWVQEFSKEGGGNHNSHIHSNSHMSGFYFLKCSDKTSYPIFHDARNAKLMIQLPQKNESLITPSSEKVNFQIKPGTFIFFNSYLGHEFVVDHGIEPFRFIHFNIQAVPKQLINNDIKRISS